MTFPFFKIGPDDSTKTAAKTMVENGITRLGVFEDEKFLGWVTLTDLAREFSKPRLLEALMAHDAPEEKKVLCPNCRKAFLKQITNSQGEILRWECPNCSYALEHHPIQRPSRIWAGHAATALRVRTVFARVARVSLRRLLLGRSWPWPGFVPGLVPCYDLLWCAA